MQGMMGHPLKRDFEAVVSHKPIENLPINANDAKHASVIFGSDLAGIRGKMVRRRPEHVDAEEGCVALPQSLLTNNRVVMLCADVFFVNRLPFLISLSRKIGLTVEFTPCRTAKLLTKHLLGAVNLYHRAGYILRMIMMDGEFKSIQELTPMVTINITAAKEHVSEEERQIRVMKERARGILTTLQYKMMPHKMVIHYMYFMMLWLNAFPMKTGIPDKFNPNEIISQQKLNIKAYCQVPFGSYCEVHDEPDTRNSMAP